MSCFRRVCQKSIGGGSKEDRLNNGFTHWMSPTFLNISYMTLTPRLPPKPCTEVTPFRPHTEVIHFQPLTEALHFQLRAEAAPFQPVTKDSPSKPCSQVSPSQKYRSEVSASKSWSQSPGERSHAYYTAINVATSAAQSAVASGVETKVAKARATAAEATTDGQ